MVTKLARGRMVWPSQFRRVKWPETLILAAALTNVVHLWLKAHSFGGGCYMCPWWYPWDWANLPGRILLASVLLLVPRLSSRLAAIVLAAQPLLLVAFFSLSPDDIRFAFFDGLSYLLPIQAAIAAGVVCCGIVRLLPQLFNSSRLRMVRIITTGMAAVAVAGYACSWLSLATCENRVADWVARVGLGGVRFSAAPSLPGWTGSLSTFQRIGADVVPRDPLKTEIPAEASLQAYPLPFVVRVRYSYSRGTARADGQGEFAFLAVPGLVTRMESGERWLHRIHAWVFAATTFPWSHLSTAGW